MMNSVSHVWQNSIFTLFIVTSGPVAAFAANIPF